MAKFSTSEREKKPLALRFSNMPIRRFYSPRNIYHIKNEELNYIVCIKIYVLTIYTSLVFVAQIIIHCLMPL